MDNQLLKMWHAIPSGAAKKQDLAEILDLSLKQTSRLLQKWSNEGWLVFTAGKGRGKVSKLDWLKNVEKYFEVELMEMIEQESVEVSSKYLLYDWSVESKMRLIDKFRMSFGYFHDLSEADKLIIPKKNPLLTKHPLEAADIYSANMIANVFNRLVSVDSLGIVEPELAHSWEMGDTRLVLYLRKDVKFHDGSTLTAEDAATCLNRLREHSHFHELWKPITSIKAVGPLVLEINFPEGCSYCLQMLGMINSSVFKEISGDVIGTGPFYFEGDGKSKTTLRAFNDYFRERPLLDAVEFIQVPKDFDSIIYRSTTQDAACDTFIVESDSGVGMMIFNAFRDSAIQRKEVRDYVHFAIAKHRHKIEAYYPRAKANHQSILIGENPNYEIPNAARPELDRPLVIKTTDYLEGATAWLKEALEEEGIPVEIQHLSFEGKMDDNGLDQQADLFVHGEVFEMNQSFSFYHFFRNGYSPFTSLCKTDAILTDRLNRYASTPFSEWAQLNLELEKYLVESSLMVPLYYERRQIPFSADLMNISISHFGYVDFSKLWVRPSTIPTG